MNDLGCFRHPWDREPCGCIATARPSHLCVLHCPEHATVVAAVVFEPLSLGTSVSSATVLPGTVPRDPVILSFTSLCLSSPLLCFESLRLRLKTLRVRIVSRLRGHELQDLGEPFCTCASEGSRSNFVSNTLAVSPQPRLPLDRAVDSEEPQPSPELSG